jgi:hypothetical protein
MEPKNASEVARRCLCLELLHQRLTLEADEDPIPERDEARRAWLSRLGDLGVVETLLPNERALLERPAGELTEDELDDIDGRAAGAVVLLWALGRVSTRPTFAAVADLASTLADHGLLGDGSIARAKAAVLDASLRSEDELRAALSTYDRTRGRAREVTDPEKIVALIAVHHLEWILDSGMRFDEADDSATVVES